MMWRGDSPATIADVAKGKKPAGEEGVSNDLRLVGDVVGVVGADEEGADTMAVTNTPRPWLGVIYSLEPAGR